MSDDNLRKRIQRLDPISDELDVEAAAAPPSRERLEHIMNTDIRDTDPNLTSEAKARSPWLSAGRNRALAASAAAAVAALVALNVGGGGGAGTEPGGETLALALGSSDALASCMPVDATVMSTMSPAFAATATSVEDGVVTLDVDHWYAGGDADIVQLTAPAGEPALIDGFTFEVGSRYLITAAEGSVNFCGFSGPATPELTAIFEEAFGA